MSMPSLSTSKPSAFGSCSARGVARPIRHSTCARTGAVGTWKRRLYSRSIRDRGLGNSYRSVHRRGCRIADTLAVVPLVSLRWRLVHRIGMCNGRCKCRGLSRDRTIYSSSPLAI